LGRGGHLVRVRIRVRVDVRVGVRATVKVRLRVSRPRRPQLAHVEPRDQLVRHAAARSLLAYLHEETPRPLLCEALPRAAEVEVVPLPRAPGRLRRRQDPVEERFHHRPQLPVQQLSPERIVVGGGPAGAARRAEREQAGGLKVRSHFDLQLGGQAEEHRE